MNRKLSSLCKKKYFAASLRLLGGLFCLAWLTLSFSACVLPGQPTPQLPPPVQDLIGTSIAETLTAFQESAKEDYKIFLPFIDNSSEQIEEIVEQSPTPTESPTVTETPTSTASKGTRGKTQKRKARLAKGTSIPFSF